MSLTGTPSAQSPAPRRAAHGRFNRVSQAAGAVAIVLIVLYPFAAYFSLRSFHPAWLAGLLIAASLARVVAARAAGVAVTPQFLAIPVGGVALAAWSLVRATPDAMLYYPVIVNAALLCVFAHSVFFPPTVVERIARLKDGPLPPEAVRYTRRVTIAWGVFFVVNGGIALYTALFTPLHTWALYNGFVAYLLIGAMFGCEWLVRMRVMAAHRRGGT